MHRKGSVGDKRVYTLRRRKAKKRIPVSTSGLTNVLSHLVLYRRRALWLVASTLTSPLALPRISWDRTLERPIQKGPFEKTLASETKDLWPEKSPKIGFVDGPLGLLPGLCQSQFRDFSRGAPMERVSVLLGDSSIKVTEKHYLPWVRGAAGTVRGGRGTHLGRNAAAWAGRGSLISLMRVP